MTEQQGDSHGKQRPVGYPERTSKQSQAAPLGQETMTYRPNPGAVPPFMDMATLCWHVSMSEDTIEREIKAGRFPEPRKNKCGKRLFVWAEVYEYLAKKDDAPTDEAERIRETVRRLSHG